MIDESEFNRLANQALSGWCDLLEEADATGLADVEQQGGVLHIAAKNGKQWVLSKHAPTMQLWLSSPVSGGLHFSYQNGMWKLPDGRSLCELFPAELKAVAQIEVNFDA